LLHQVRALLQGDGVEKKEETNFQKQNSSFATALIEPPSVRAYLDANISAFCSSFSACELGRQP
jgi:hypothetical protein